MINEKVPSPLSVTVAFTPEIAVKASANPVRVLLPSVIEIDCEVCAESAVKAVPSIFQEPKSMLIVPLLTAAVLLEKPENSSV